MSEITSDERVLHLFGVPFDQFVEERNNLAKELRAAGDREAADTVRRLSKPTLPAWVVNRLSRTRRSDVKRLIAAADAIRGAYGGPPDKFRDAGAAEREAVAKLVDAAGAVLREAGREPSEAVLQRVATTLHAAAADPGFRDVLEAGALTEELEPRGFDVLSGISLPAQEAPTPARKRATEPNPRLDKLRAEIAEAKSEARVLERQAHEAETAAQRARAKADRAATKLEHLEQRLTDEQRSG